MNIPPKMLKILKSVRPNGSFHICVIHYEVSNRHFIYIEDENEDSSYGNFVYLEMKESAHCCGLVEVGNLFVDPRFRRQGLVKYTHEILIQWAKEHQYGSLLCTTVPKEARGLGTTLVDCGWVLAGKFTNPKTRNVVETYVYSITKARAKKSPKTFVSGR